MTWQLNASRFMDSRPSNPELNFDDTFQLDDTDWQGLVDLDNEAHIHRSGDGSSGLSDHLPAGPGGASFPMSYTFSGASSYEDVPTYSWSMPPPLTNASSFQTSNQASYHSANLLEDESVFPGYFNVNSAPGSFDNNELVLPSRPKTPEFTPAERHAESTPISIPRATQTKQRRRRTSFGASSASAQKWIQYKPDEGKTGRLVTFSANSHGVVRKNRGRTGGLSPIARKEAAAMRIIGACDSCRRRKEKVGFLTSLSSSFGRLILTYLVVSAIQEHHVRAVSSTSNAICFFSLVEAVSLRTSLASCFLVGLLYSIRLFSFSLFSHIFFRRSPGQ
ncbi:hypothetical protein EJ05DRAFT_55177 [Pseudovirgaria hyperparasitica]|uniref:Uncharacterized protein n=1 Tax=Pseudovirgaria hyperparasitica TaxID=470096 RepID=A0A6A6W545_9PEZI|nr:uncharacterized protein EJ05DRAFT_55177 [Pseudovirgaria hyperparasitica]KAF2757076.1 hypothetical protein EJ05DRAFT_55177 [Pseudovirgaria hyperparasitica]